MNRAAPAVNAANVANKPTFSGALRENTGFLVLPVGGLLGDVLLGEVLPVVMPVPVDVPVPVGLGLPGNGAACPVAVTSA